MARLGASTALGLGSALLLIACACASSWDRPSRTRSWSAADLGCVGCHAGIADAVGSAPMHGGRGSAIGCLDCHLRHAPDVGDGLGAAGMRASCEDCHAESLADFRLPFRHPLDASIACTSCHPAHGLPSFELRDHLRFESCVECHAEYAGPYVFDHEGSETRQCLSCHEAHGSSNRRLLTYGESFGLCQSCHPFLDKSHVLDPGSPFRDCLNCHTEIHGSNFDRHLLR